MKRLRYLILSLLGCLTRLGAADPVPQAENKKPVELPEFNVIGERELPPPEAWHYARLEGFEVLSSASEAKTRSMVTELQRYAYALNAVWPGMKPNRAAPAALIICGDTVKFGKFRPENRGASTTSFSLHTRDFSALVLNEGAKLVGLAADDLLAAPTAAAVTGSETGETTTEMGVDLGFRVDPQAQLQREYVRFILAGLEPAPAPWLSEGLAQLCGRLRITETEISLGRVESPNEESETTGIASAREDRDFNRSLAGRSLIPLGEMFAVAADSETAKATVNNAWAKQCYAFIHWGLYGDLGHNQQAFFTFLKRSGREPLTEALFKDCFKKSYADMLVALRSHIENTRAKVAGVRAGPGEKIPWPAIVAVREATEGEIGRIKSDAMLAAGKPAEARAALVDAYRRGERDPAFLAVLGASEYENGDRDRARKFLELAAKSKAARPQAYVALARIRLADRLAKPQGKDGKLSYEQLLGVLEPLLLARTQAPRLPEVYQLFAEAWAQTAMPPPAQHLALVDEGLKLFPDHAALRAAREKLGPTATAK